MQITDLVINETIRFIKRYPEYVEDGIVLVRTDTKTIYKLLFMDAEFIKTTHLNFQEG